MTDDEGPLRVTDDEGPLEVTDDEGPLRVTDDEGPLEVTDDEGPLEVTGDEKETADEIEDDELEGLLPDELPGEDEDMEMLLPDELPADHRSGFVAVVGKPNVGKSTLMNAYLGQKIAIVSPKPQTTRNRLLGILTLEKEGGDPVDAQIVFVDTPGIHRPLHKLGEFMVETAVRAIPDADLVLFMVDASTAPDDEDREIAGILRRQAGVATLLVLNKADLVPAEVATARLEEYGTMGAPAEAGSVAISALKGDNRDRLLEMVVAHLPPGPRYFPREQVTDQQLRFMAAELVREQAMLQLRQELPYSLAVVVDQFTERSADMTYISATILVERDTQKAIILGRGGETIKRIGSDARRQIEDLLGTRVYLELWVKVRPKWRRNERELWRLGYAVDKGS